MSGPLATTGGSAAGAPVDAQYVVLVANATLTVERVLTGTANEIVVTDGGAGAAVTLSAGTLIVQTDQANTWTVGAQQITIANAAVKGLIIKAAAVQTASTFEVQDSLGAALLSVAGVNSSTFLQIKRADGTVVTTINTSNSRLQHNGNAKIGENAAPLKTLDVTGQVILSDNGTNNVLKRALIVMKQYASAAETEGFTLISGTATADNICNFGGGNGDANAATQVSFWTAADAVTRTGTVRMFIDNAGLISVGGNPSVTSGQFKVEPLLTTTIGLIIKGAAAQTADLQQWQTSVAAVLLSVQAAGHLQFGEAVNVIAGTTTGTMIGTATAQKLGFWGLAPVVQQVLATGAGATVDNVISMLQTLGLCKQA